MSTQDKTKHCTCEIPRRNWDWCVTCRLPIAEQSDLKAQLVEALKAAKECIHNWQKFHSGGEEWESYQLLSPEMQQINAALKAAEEQK